MEIMIVGAGRVGSNLAEILMDAGEDITIVEANPENLAKVAHLDCTQIQGVPIERAVLEKAGIQNVEAVLCMTDNENMNVMVGQIAVKLYNVNQVIVRIFNPGNETAYQALGLQTICSTSMTLAKTLSVLGLSQSEDLTSVLGYPIRYDLREVTASWEGKTVAEVEQRMKLHVLAIASDDMLRLVARDYVFTRGEHVILVTLPDEDKEDRE